MTQIADDLRFTYCLDLFGQGHAWLVQTALMPQDVGKRLCIVSLDRVDRNIEKVKRFLRKCRSRSERQQQGERLLECDHDARRGQQGKCHLCENSNFC